MRLLGALLLVAQHRCRSQVHGQEPRLPAPAATPSESEALIQRARALSAAGNHRESAAAWQTRGAREPVIASLATRESIRALIAAGDIERGHERSHRARHRGACRSPSSRRRLLPRNAGVRLRRRRCIAARARPRAGRPLPTKRPSASRGRSSRPVSRARRSRPIASSSSRSAKLRRSSSPTRARGVSRPSSADAEPLTEADYDSDRRSARRRRGVPARRRHADRMAEELPRLRAPRGNRVGQWCSISIRCARTTKRGFDAHAFLKQHPDSAETRTTSSSRCSGSTSAKGAQPMSRSAAAPSWRATSPARRSAIARAPRGCSRNIWSASGSPPKPLGVYSALYKMTTTRGGRVDVLWRMAIASLRAGNPARAIKELQQVLRLEAGFRD